MSESLNSMDIKSNLMKRLNCVHNVRGTVHNVRGTVRNPRGLYTTCGDCTQPAGTVRNAQEAVCVQEL